MKRIQGMWCWGEKKESNWGEICEQGAPDLAMDSTWENGERKDSSMTPTELLLTYSVVAPSLDHETQEEEWDC